MESVLLLGQGGMHSTPRIALSDLSVCGCVGGGKGVKRCERIGKGKREAS